VFFGNCNMRCAYCQNYQISQDWKRQKSREMDFPKLAEEMLYLQDVLEPEPKTYVAGVFVLGGLLASAVETSGHISCGSQGVKVIRVPRGKFSWKS